MNTTGRIPKRIIQTGRSLDLPPALRGCVNATKLANPEYEYLFFDDNRIEAFFDSIAPEYRRVFDSFPLTIQKIDFFRYVAVYKLGGFYFDTDVLLASGLDKLLQFGCVFPFERLTWSHQLRSKFGMDWEMGNYAFGAEPHHPFMLSVIQNCERAQLDPVWAFEPLRDLPGILRSELTVIYTSGPGLVSRTLAEAPSLLSDLKILFPNDVCNKKLGWSLFGEFGVHLGEGSWRERRGGISRRWLQYLERRNEDQAIAYTRTTLEHDSLQAGFLHSTVNQLSCASRLRAAEANVGA